MARAYPLPWPPCFAKASAGVSQDEIWADLANRIWRHKNVRIGVNLDVGFAGLQSLIRAHKQTLIKAKHLWQLLVWILRYCSGARGRRLQ